jgi:hypothetical protein
MVLRLPWSPSAPTSSTPIADAEENLGEVEVREAHIAKSLYFIRVGEKVLGGKSHNQDTSELVTLV